jgi:nucleotide-binding universal stress UspA family protein
MNITKILAGIDFEKDTEKVLAYASYFAENYNASLDILHVLDYLVTPPAYLMPYIEEEKKNVVQKFAALKKELADSGIRAEAEVIAGRLRESFDMTIKNQSADMLVLGFMSHVFRRSSSERLIKGLRIPMLVVRGDKSESAKVGSLKVRKILCPTDFSEISGKALNAAKELAVKLSAQLEIVHVFPNAMFDQIIELKDRDILLKELYNESKASLEKFLYAAGLSVHGTMEEGEPDRRIVSFAKEKDIDLIVMGARGLGRIEGMLIGSITDAVLKSAPCPVLVIH